MITYFFITNYTDSPMSYTNTIEFIHQYYSCLQKTKNEYIVLCNLNKATE